MEQSESSNDARKIQEIKDEMEALREQKSSKDWNRQNELRLQLSEAYREEEAYWCQKDRLQ